MDRVEQTLLSAAFDVDFDFALRGDACSDVEERRFSGLP